MKHITDLENIQHRATKLIPDYKDLENTDIKRLNLPTLSYLCVRWDMIAWKMKYDSAVASNIFTLRENGHKLYLKIFKERYWLNILKKIDTSKHWYMEQAPMNCGWRSISLAVWGNNR